MKNMYIKLHIRSDISLYENLSKKSNVILLKDSFPKCNKYIGHYSSIAIIFASSFNCKQFIQCFIKEDSVIS